MTSVSDTGSRTATPPSQPRQPAQPRMDWGRGRYERTAAALAPAAQVLVSAARLLPGERALDLGCGTGTVALMAARAGVHVTALDPAPRLLDVARGLAHEEGLTVRFCPGEASSLPLPDRSFDAVLSNFAVIFAPDPSAAVAEMVRVLTSHGRIVLSAWVPGGGIGQLNAAAMDLVNSALGAPPPPTPFPWFNPAALGQLFEAHDMTVTVREHALAFVGESPAAYLDAERVSHPMAITGFELLEKVGQAERAHEQLLRILQDANEDPSGFRSTSRYVVVTATRT